jgi:hypothetical protein
MGVRDLETISVEVKTTHTSWRKMLFEAVSHKRFAHRVFFAFAYSAENVPQRDIDAMRGYGEKFGIGILGLRMTPDKFDTLTRGDKIAVRDIDLVLNDDVAPELHWPAVREEPLFDEHLSFLDRIAIREEPDIYSFGKYRPE